MNTVASLRALVGETAVLDASALATRSAGVLRSDHLKATLIKSLAARSSRSRAVCRVAKPRRAARPACVLRLAAHPDSGRSHPRGLVQRRPKGRTVVDGRPLGREGWTGQNFRLAVTCSMRPAPGM
mgnify:CR=1 FL=1